MPNDDILVSALLRASSYSEIHSLRQRMDNATAKRVIRHPEISDLDRACLSLCLNFGQPSRFGHGQGSIIHDPDVSL